MRLILLSFLSCIAGPIFGQQAFPAKQLNNSAIPSSLKFKGKPVVAWSWKDGLGENILILSKVESFPDKKADPNIEDETFTAELHVFQYLKKDSIYSLLWKTSDAQKQCAFDLTAEFITAATKITDLDADGIAETTVQYKLACRSDVSPAQMKLIMHEDSIKYALRGHMWLKTAEDSRFNLTHDNLNLETLKKAKAIQADDSGLGRYQHERDFSNAPAAFLSFARRQWLAYVKESFE